MTTHEPVPRFQLASPGDVAQLVPYLLGFDPQDSLVLLVTRQGRVEVTARADLADVQPHGQVEHLIDRIWGRFPDADAFMVAYTDQPAQGWAVLRRGLQHLPSGADGQCMLVASGAWHTQDGATGPVDRFGPIAAEAAYAGLAASRSRADLEASFASPADSVELERAVASASGRLPAVTDTARIVERTQDLICQYRRGDNDEAPKTAPRIPAEDAAQLALLGLTSAGRDTALLSITGPDAASHLELWRTVVNSVPGPYAEAAAYLAGMAAWVTGDGAAANVALSRSIAIAEGAGVEPMARLLDNLIDQVVPPTAWEQVREHALTLTQPEVRQAIQTTAPTPNWESVPPPAARPTRQRPGETPPAPGIGI